MSDASQSSDQSCHWYGPFGGSSFAGCQSPSPVKLTWTSVTGPVPDHAFPRTVYSAGGDRRAGGGVGDAGADAHQGDAFVLSIRPFVDVVAGLKLAHVRFGQDVDPLQPFHGGDGVPVGHDQPEGGSVVGGQRLAVHLVGDQDLCRRIGCVGEGERAHEAQVGLVGLRKHRLEVIRAVVGALEADLDAVRCRAGRAPGPRAGGRPSTGRSRPRSRPMARRPAAAASRGARSRHIRASRRARPPACARRSSSVSLVGLSTAPPTSSVPSWLGTAKLLRT